MAETTESLMAAVPQALVRTDLPELGKRIEGKVRDIYLQDDRRVLITTDRVSAFDRVLGAIPYKGQVLNQLSAWWFRQIEPIVANHVLAVPDPNVTIGAEAEIPLVVLVDALRPGGGTSLRARSAIGAGKERPTPRTGDYPDHQGDGWGTRRTAYQR